MNSTHRVKTSMFRGAAATLAAAGLLVLPSLAGWGGPSDLASASETQQAAASSAAASAGSAGPDGLAACAAAGGQVDVLMLIDESGSLTESDPDGARVRSAQYLVDRLADNASDQSRVDLSLMAFGDRQDELRGWTRVDQHTGDSLRGDIESLQQRSNGVDTDYWSALNAANSALASKRASAPEGVRSCQTVLLFSDGKLDFYPRQSIVSQQRYGTQRDFAPGLNITSPDAAAQAADRAKSDLCRAGGLSDQLRNAGVTVYAVGLNAGSSSADDFSLLKSIATGKTDGGESCGEHVDPVPGAFFLASNIDGLLLAFDSLADPAHKPIESKSGICQHEACLDKAHHFVLDDSTPGVTLLGTADTSDVEATIIQPDGQEIKLDKGASDAQQISAEGVAGTYRWESSSTVLVKLTANDPHSSSWAGEWSLAFIDPNGASPDGTSRTNIHIAGDLRPALASPEKPVFTKGADGPELTVQIRDGKGGVVDPNSIKGDVDFSLTLIDHTGKSHELSHTADKSQIGAPITANTGDLQVGTGTLQGSLTITTAATQRADGTPVAGTKLAPSTFENTVDLRMPANYPTVSSHLDFGSATGPVDLQSGLEVSGNGCVWVDSTDAAEVTSLATGLDSVQIVSDQANDQSSCAKSGTLPLQLKSDQQGNGSVDGTVTVHLIPEGDGEPTTVQVPFTASVEKPLNSTNFVLVLIALIVLGVGLPLLVLYAAKWVASRIPSQSLIGFIVDVTVENGSVLSNGQQYQTTLEQRRNMLTIPKRGTRSLQVGDVTLQTTIGASPLGSGFVRVNAPGRSSASSGRPSTDKTELSAVLPLSLQDHWVVLHTPGQPDGQAQVLVLLSGLATDEQVRDFDQKLSQDLPKVFERLTRAEQGREASGPHRSPFGRGGKDSAPVQSAAAPASPFADTAAASPFGSGASPFDTGTSSGSGASPFSGGSTTPGGQSPFGGEPFGGEPFGGAANADRGQNPFSQNSFGAAVPPPHSEGQLPLPGGASVPPKGGAAPSEGRHSGPPPRLNGNTQHPDQDDESQPPFGQKPGW
ncbi:VWA domain-containing protein [Pseudoclavibacter sp. CFCC 14310]|uniref:VWA domain-containing protein n=1 Tax=Pseudoclavibacter sp. CFCC 14310 TaxID=2615180 RepID=UPI0013012CBF|nr:VWA domain-containing protein [Pseudoclavibacter sp. CFCC 14310]KAB1644321.1 VWA domain-containing protein [Pseudoclavibacter sp. CFCC 14310]